MTAKTRATAVRRAVVYAALAALCLPASWVIGQHRNEAPRPAAHPAPARPAPAPRGQQGGRAQQPQGRQNNTVPRMQQGNPYSNQQGVSRPVYPGANAGTNRGGYPGTVRPALPPNAMVPGAPPGHLQSWLNEHRNVPVQNQEQQLRTDPSFKRLPPGEQQRLVQQLHNVNQMPDEVRQRRLARAELMERLSPQDRMHVNRSAREWTTLPSDRQAQMKSAFRDLRGVPPDQRSIVLNSARYQGQFSPQERGILSDMLRVEPYEAPR